MDGSRADSWLPTTPAKPGFPPISGNVQVNQQAQVNRPEYRGIPQAQDLSQMNHLGLRNFWQEPQGRYTIAECCGSTSSATVTGYFDREATVGTKSMYRDNSRLGLFTRCFTRCFRRYSRLAYACSNRDIWL